MRFPPDGIMGLLTDIELYGDIVEMPYLLGKLILLFLKGLAKRKRPLQNEKTVLRNISATL